jgi:hypothetical protein
MHKMKKRRANPTRFRWLAAFLALALGFLLLPHVHESCCSSPGLRFENLPDREEGKCSRCELQHHVPALLLPMLVFAAFLQLLGSSEFSVLLPGPAETPFTLLARPPPLT